MQFNNTNRTVLTVFVALMVIFTGCLGGATPADSTAESAEQADPTKQAESMESTESTKSTESAKSIESTKSVESSGTIDIAVDGAITPGNTVSITAMLNGNPVSGADVYVKDGNGDRQFVGKTDEMGKLDVTVPSTGDKAGELNVKVRMGELEGEFEVEPASVERESEGGHAIDVRVEGDIEPGATVLVVASLDGEPVSGAGVYVKDGDGDRQFVGQTNERGELEVTVPATGDKAGELNVKVRLGELEGEFEFDN